MSDPAPLHHFRRPSDRLRQRRRRRLRRCPELAGPIVGRESELAQLQAAWDRARSGRGELILLTGEAGIGKSRLGRELLQEAALDGGLPLYGRAYPPVNSFLYQPLIEPLRHALLLAEQQRLTLCEPIWLAEVALLLPEQRHEAERGTVLGTDRSGRLEEGLTRFFLALSTQRPICLFLDDLQWADSATGRFLFTLSHRAREGRLLLIGAYRADEVPGNPWLGPWETDVLAQRMARMLPLSNLTEEDIVGLLWQLAEGKASEELVQLASQRLYQETEGNPFFLLEQLRVLFEEDSLELTEEGRWQGAPERLTRSFPLPATVQRVVRHRVSHLSEQDAQLLACAAVIGRRFPFEALYRAAGREMESTLAALERLLAADLLRAQQDSAGFDFSHDKIREVVYEDLSPAQRQELHRRVGEALEAIYVVAGSSRIEDPPYPTWDRRRPPPPARARAEEHAEDLARHFREAAPLIGVQKAVYYYYLAGSYARALCAYEKAVSDLLAAQGLLEELPLDEARLAQWGQIVEQLVPAYRSTGRPEAAWQLLKDHIALCEQRSYARGIARGCTLMGLFLELNPRLAGKETSQAMYQRAIGICEAHGLHDWIVYPQSRLAWVLAESGSGAEVARAQELMRVCLPVAETQQDVRLLVDLYCTQMWIATRQIDWEALKRAFRLSLAYGGITEIYLWLVLEAIEATCHRVGAHATFAELCREMMEEYTRVGREAPLQQWYLAPTAPRDPASLGARPDAPDVREEFEGEGWHPSLRWQDSMGGSRVDRTTRRGWLGISPAVGAGLWPETNLKAPRLVARVRGDYVVQTRVDLGESVDTNVGLLLWQDEQDFVRLELHRVRTSKERAAVYLAACVEGRFRIIGRGHCERRPMWLRVERAGEEVRGLCSADGEHWLACGSVRVPQRTEEVVGLAAHSIYPGEHVWFDTLLLWERSVRIL